MRYPVFSSTRRYKTIPLPNIPGRRLGRRLTYAPFPAITQPGESSITCQSSTLKPANRDLYIKTRINSKKVNKKYLKKHNHQRALEESTTTINNTKGLRTAVSTVGMCHRTLPGSSVRVIYPTLSQAFLPQATTHTYDTRAL